MYLDPVSPGYNYCKLNLIQLYIYIYSNKYNRALDIKGVDDVTVVEGSDATMSCKFTVLTDRPKVKWYKISSNGSAIENCAEG